MNMYSNHQTFSVIHQAQDWCMDFVVDGPNWMTFKQQNFLELSTDYPGVSMQPQTCAQLGMTATHISPLYGVQSRTYVDANTGVNVTTSYWMRP